MKNRPRRFVLYLLLLVLVGIVRCLPRVLALALADFGGWFAYYTVIRQRRKIDENVAFIFPGFSKTKRNRFGYRCFQNIARTLVDVILFYRINAKNVEKWLDADEVVAALKKLLKKGNGAILLSSHFGNWEFISVLALLGLPGAAVARRIYYNPYNRLLIKNRERFGCRTMYRDSSPRLMLQTLARGEVLGIIPDQDMDSIDGVFVDFFGHPARTPTAPVKLAIASGAPILPVAVARMGKRYKFLVGKPIECAYEGDKDKAIRHFTQQWSRALEGFIREYPEQWVWMHKRWKSKSESEALKS